MALFGGPRAIWIEPAGDEITDGVAALLEASVTESAVIAIAGSLRKTSSLLKLAEAHQAAAACASYAPEGRNASKMVVAIGRDEGLAIDLSVAERIADEADGNRAVAANELAKYALYLGASREQPKPLSHEVVDLLGCGSGDGNVQRLGDLALDGDVASLIDEMDRAGIAASEAVSVMRALQRRLMGIVPLSARAAGGESLSGVMASAGRSIFWKEKDFVERMLRIWPAERLARLIERTAEVEQALMLSDVPEVASVGEHLIAIGRVAERRR
jgi:DNA polymerase-3 subunit delta